MKRLLSILLFTVISFTQVLAHDRERSVINVRLSDNSEMVVSVDNRNYDRVGRSITIGNLPSGWHTLRVYEFLEYKRGGGRAKLLYSGRLRINPGTVTNCVVDPNTGRMRYKILDKEEAYIDYERYDGEEQYHDDNNGHHDHPQPVNAWTTQDMNDLKTRVDDRITDTEKLKLMKSVLEGRRYTSTEVRTMMGWLAFESSRLDLAKWSYSNITDRNDYWKLEDEFTFSSSKEEFSNYIKSH